MRLLSWHDPVALKDVADAFNGTFAVLCRIPFTQTEIVLFRKYKNFSKWRWLDMKTEQPIRAWHIGEHGDVFAGRCDEPEIKEWFHKLLGNHDEADEAIESCFEELSQDEMDSERNWSMDGTDALTSYRKEAENCGELPMQISTTYA